MSRRRPARTARPAASFEEQACKALNNEALIAASKSPRAEKPAWATAIKAEMERRGL